MATTALLIDHLPVYGGRNGDRTSLLPAPIGPGTLLSLWQVRLEEAEVDSITVVPRFACDGPYSQQLREIAPEVRVVTPDGAGTLLGELEPSDRALLVDARYFTVEGAVLGSLLHQDSQAVHLMHLPARDGEIRERVVMDDRARVQCVERLYAGVSDFEAPAVLCSLITGAAARRLVPAQLGRLEELRSALVAAGVLSRDNPASGLVMDLALEQNLVSLNEHILAGLGGPQCRRLLRQVQPDVWAADSCRIHPGCTLRGPAVIGPDVSVDAGARVLGPVTLGPGAHIGAHALVSRCVIGRDVRVPAGVRIANRAVLAPLNGNSEHAVSWLQQLHAERIDTDLRASRAARARRPLGSRVYGAAKRAFDFTAALSALVLLSPVLAAVAVLIRFTSPGPVFFAHRREGRGGRVFRCWKFRTMVQHAHAQQRGLSAQNAVDGPQFKLANDPRVTRLGRVLRVSNLDELPQLFNVLWGHMSLIGPRPSPFRENQVCIPWRAARLSVRPGITGLWQVCRHDRASGDFHQWIYFDVLYARHQSFALDMRILLATFLTLGGRWSVPLAWMIPGYRSSHVPPAAQEPLPDPPPQPAVATG